MTFQCLEEVTRQRLLTSVVRHNALRQLKDWLIECYYATAERRLWKIEK